MGCNCNKPKPPPPTNGQTQQFALEGRDGTRQTFGSQLEADAENVRRGLIGTVRPI